MSSKQLRAIKSVSQKAHIVPYLTPEEVHRIIDATWQGNKGDRDGLLIKTLFESGLRISEALSLKPNMIGECEGYGVLYVVGKGNKPRMVACPDGLAHQLRSRAYMNELRLDDRLFKINRKRAWQIFKKAAKMAGIGKRVYPHLFRHADAIERLRQIGNPRALQYHLGAQFYSYDNEIFGDLDCRRSLEDSAGSEV